MANTISKPIALAIAAGITLSGSFGAGAPAFAQDDAGRNVDAAVESDQNDGQQILPPAATIPNTNDFSLTIHKRLNPSSLGDATGNQDDNVSGEPLDGAHFQIQKLEGDIREQSVLSNLTAVASEYNRKMGAWRGKGGLDTPPLDQEFGVKSGVTGADGQPGELKFANLKPGAYLVTETQTPNADGAQGFVKTKPYIVLVPTVNKEGTEWVKEVHTYPKNSAVRVSKQVQDAKKHSLSDFRDNPETSTVGYTLIANVPMAPEQQELEEFVIQDSYNNDELGIDDNFKPVVRKLREGATEAEIVDESNYQVLTQQRVASNSKNLPTDANESFKIVFNNPDAADIKGGDTILVDFTATLLNADDQDVENAVNSSGTINGPETSRRFETPNDKVVTHIGNIRIIKEDDQDNTKKLEGAVFGLAYCKAPQDYFQTGTTDANGEVTFEGIHVSDWINNEAPAEAEQYCLTEIDAPKGYIKTRENPYVINLNRDSKEFIGEGNERQTIRRVSLEVTNLQDTERPTLPKTGGMGILLVALLGLGIIGGGVYAARRNSATA